jgi:hypothetical protein
MTITARFFRGETPADVPLGSNVAAMPTASTWLAPGIYTYQGQVYDCREEGLYRFFNETNGSCFNRLVIKGSGQADLYKVLSGVCWNHVHGIDDNATDYQLMSNAGMTRKWRAQCGYIVGLMTWVLPQFGIQARAKNPSAVSPLNGWDDGHIVLETLHGSDWRMWDMTTGRFFRNGAGKHLSTAEVVAAVNAGTFDALQQEFLCSRWRFESDTIYGIDLSIYGDMRFMTPEQQASWYKRLFRTVA